MNKLPNQFNDELIKFSRKEFIKKFAVPKCQMMFMDVKTTKVALSKDVPTLSMIKRTYGTEFVLAYFETWLYNLNDYFNLARKLNRDQISETAVYIYQDFYYLKLSEINLVMTKMKKGLQGPYYQSIDGSTIYSYFNEYKKDRIEFYLKQDREKIDNKPSIKEKARNILLLLIKKYNIEDFFKKIE